MFNEFQFDRQSLQGYLAAFFGQIETQDPACRLSSLRLTIRPRFSICGSSMLMFDRPTSSLCARSCCEIPSNPEKIGQNIQVRDFNIELRQCPAEPSGE